MQTTKLTAQEIIRLEYGNSKNLMTPTVVSYGKIQGIYAYEISKGRGITDTVIYGLSVVKYDPDHKSTERLYEASGCFNSLDEVRAQVKELRKKLAWRAANG